MAECAVKNKVTDGVEQHSLLEKVNRATVKASPASQTCWSLEREPVSTWIKGSAKYMIWGVQTAFDKVLHQSLLRN